MSSPNALLQYSSVHSVSADGKYVAIAQDNIIYVYEATKLDDQTSWKKMQQLEDHSGIVSGLHWNPVTNQLASCGQDRNAYVWNLVNGEWKPTLVILRINRAATCIKWSPAGNKLAVGSSAKILSICMYEQANDWYISKTMKKFKSTILSVDWSINNKFVITGCSDNKLRVFSAYVDGFDNAEDDGFGEVFADQHDFGELLYELDCGSWVHGVAWSPRGDRLVACTHSSTYYFISLIAGSSPYVYQLTNSSLPSLDISFIDNNTVVAVGYEMNPILFTQTNTDDTAPVWSFKTFLDTKDSANKSSAATTSAFSGARALFQDSSSKGVSFGQKDESNVWTRHKSYITSICCMNQNGNVSSITTSGNDGRICVWKL